MPKKSVKADGVIITDRDFNIKYINSSARQYIRTDNFLKSISRFPFSEKVLERKDFCNVRARIYADSNFFDVLCSGEYGDDYCFIIKDIQPNLSIVSYCKEGVKALVNDLLPMASMIDANLSILKVFKDGCREGLIDSIKATSVEMRRILSDCMEIINIEGGYQSPKLSVFDFAFLIREVAKNVSSYMDGGVSFNFRGRERLELFADFAMIQKLLLILISNIARFSDEECIITVDLSEASECAVLRITDNNKNVPFDLLNSIFTTEEMGEYKDNMKCSIGIEMALCKKYVEINGGKISVTKLQRGVAVLIEIPIRENRSLISSNYEMEQFDLDWYLFDVRMKKGNYNG